MRFCPAPKRPPDCAAPFPAYRIWRLAASYPPTRSLRCLANATWHISPKFDLSFGGRWSDNDQDASQVLDAFLFPWHLIVFDKVNSSESPFTWSMSPRYEFTDTTSMYVRVATGFRPGGPNVLAPGTPAGTPTSYDSDELTNYEIGLKTGKEAGTLLPRRRGLLPRLEGYSAVRPG